MNDRPNGPVSASHRPAAEAGARRFLLIMGLGPLLLTLLAATAAGPTVTLQ